MQLKPQYRDFQVSKINKESRTVELSFSSETPYERYWGIEILDHSTTSVNMERLNNDAPLLFNHDRDIVVGVVQNAYIENSRGKAVVRFGNSKKAKEVFSDVEDGILKNVSVGYEIREMVKESSKDGVETYRVTDWQPMEISIVSIPADNTVGVGRNNDLKEKEILIKEIDTMKEQVKEVVEETKTAEAPQVDIKAIQEEARKAEVERVREINAIAEKFGKRDLADEAINNGVALNEFRAKILENIKSENEIMTKTEEIGMTEKEQTEYSFARALKASITGDWSGAELEKEMSDKTAKMSGRDAKGFYVPSEILQRDLTNANSGAIVGTNHLGSSFIEILRNKLALVSLGAQTLTGLSGNISIPKQTGGVNVSWIDPSTGTATKSDMTFGSIGMSPKEVAGYTAYSRSLLLQGNPSVEALVMNDLATSIALEIDRAGIAGSGIAGEPTGILNTTGIGAVSMATATGGASFAKVVDMEVAVESANADINVTKYLTNSSVAGTLKTTEKAAGYPQYVLDKKEMNGYEVAVSNQIPANSILFGDFSQLVIGMWGGLDIVTNRLNSNGMYEVSAFQSVDFAVRHPESFVAATDVNL